MRMGLGPAAIVTIVVVAEAELEHFAQLLQQVERLVDGRQAGRRELGLDLLIQVAALGCPSLRR
jgi:hypothetical protein